MFIIPRSRILAIFSIVFLGLGFASGAEKPVKRLKLSPEKREALANASMQVSNDPAADVFVIEDRVILEDPPNIGCEIPCGNTKPWFNTVSFNQWMPGGAFEPVEFQYYWVLDEKQNVVATPNSITSDHTTYYAVYQDDFFNGADFRLYRDEGDRTHSLIHQTTVTSFTTDPDGPKNKEGRCKRATLTLADSGPVAQVGDVYVLDMTFCKPNVPQRYFKEKRYKHVQEWLAKFEKAEIGKGATAEIDPSQAAPEGGSTSSLCIKLPDKGRSEGYQWFTVADNDNWPFRLRFYKDKTYCFQTWMRQEDMPEGKVRLSIPGYLDETVTVTKEWKKYSFEFSGSTTPPATVSKSGITSREPGTLWLDNVALYQTDLPLDGYNPRLITELKKMRPSTLRSMHFSLYFFSLKGMLGEYFDASSIWNCKKSGGIKHSGGPGLGTFLKICQEVGADPWINFHIFSREECLNMMEYLAGPADSPYGKLRQKVGQIEPWTEVFGRIHLEHGNEPWGHMFFPMSSDTYIASCNRVFGECQESPYYQRDKFNFIAGGWCTQNKANGYNDALMTHGKTVDTIASFAGYFGGWDGLILNAERKPDFFQQQLLYVPLIEEGRLAAAGELRDLRGRGPGTERPLQISTYEYGPGYALPGPKRPFIEESEKTGKSLALAIATIDRSMLYLEYGYRGIQSFYKFGVGPNFSTHSDQFETRPNPMWLGLSMFNNLCEGDFLACTPSDVSTVDWPDMLVEDLDWRGNKREKILKGRKDIQMVKCFPFRSGKRHAFLLYSRWYGTARQVTLRLPYEPQSQVVFHKLTHDDPAAGNRSEMNVDIKTETRNDFSKEYTFTLPPSSLYVLVNQAR